MQNNSFAIFRYRRFQFSCHFVECGLLRKKRVIHKRVVDKLERTGNRSLCACGSGAVGWFSDLALRVVLDDKSALVAQLTGKLGIVYMSLFLHVFSFDHQVTVAKRVFSLLADKPGSLLVCRVVACRDQDAVNATSARLPYFYHDLAS